MNQFLYHSHDMMLLSFSIARSFANAARSVLENSDSPLSELDQNKALAAEFEIFDRTFKHFEKPAFNILSTLIGTKKIKIEEEIVLEKTFCHLLHFKKKSKIKQEKILIVAPLSGHFATLLRDTVIGLLPHFDVYITDWEDPTIIPLSKGDFSLDDYISYLLDFFAHLKNNFHILAVCQPVVPVLIATSLTHQLNLAHKPKSMILMGGPVDARINPTKINILSKGIPLEIFEQFIISEVPSYYAGYGRKVCPGFLILSTFMSMNVDRHFKSHIDFIENSFQGESAKVDSHKKFYDEYLSVMDLPAQYFLDSVHHIFHEYTLPRGLYIWKDTLIDLSSIHQTGLMTIEGAHDDMSGIGQTKAAHNLCTNIPAKNHIHYQHPDAGHYGIFSGHKWREDIVPQIVEFTEKI